MKNLRQTCVAFCAGFSAGIAATALFTPKSGSALRRSIAETAQAGKENLRIQAQEAGNSAASWIKEHNPFPLRAAR